MAIQVPIEPGKVVPRPIVTARSRGDSIYRATVKTAGATTLVLMGLIGFFLFLGGREALSSAGWRFFTTQAWSPTSDPPQLGIAAIMFGTIVIAVVALAVAVPIAIGSALFINEYSPRRLRRPLVTLVDLLAAIPSLIYGLWGREFLQPYLINVSRWLETHLGFLPIFQTQSGRYASSNFIAGVVVSLMVLPIATSIMREVFAQAPAVEKEGALALGGTRWGMIRTVVLPFGRGGIIGGSMLGLGRALGETIAVALIISPTFRIRATIIEQGGNSVASHIALRFGEATGVERSALLAAGLALFIITLIVNLIASAVVARSRSGQGVEI